MLNWRKSHFTVTRDTDAIMCDCIVFHRKRICHHVAAVSALTNFEDSGDIIVSRKKRGAEPIKPRKTPNFEIVQISFFKYI